MPVRCLILVYSTSTATTTVTVTHAPVFKTATTIVTDTMVNTVTETDITVVTTIEDTATVFETSTVEDVSTIIVAATTTAAMPFKRALIPLPTLPAQIQARSAPPTSQTTATSASTCSATTNSPSNVPAYASACSGTVRYSSACSCAGVTGATTTVSQSTTTTTTTSTVTVTPTLTAVVTATDEVPVTTTQTEFVPTTFETTDATVIIPTQVTETSSVTVTTTVVATPTCNAYYLLATSGRTGQYLGNDNIGQSAFIPFVTDVTQAIPYVIQSNGRVVYYDNTHGTAQAWTSKENMLYYILGVTPANEAAYGSALVPVYCTVFDNTLLCTVGGNAVVLQYCPDTNGNNLAQDTSLDPDCEQVDLSLVPAGTVNCVGGS